MFHLVRTRMTHGGSTAPTGLRRSILPALALVCLCGPTVLPAQEDKLPKAEVILDKYVEVTGGKAAYAKLKNCVSKMTLDPVGSGMKIAMTVFAARPDKIYAVMESEAFGKIERGTDGQVVWESSVMTGPVIKQGNERDLFLRASVFDGAVQWRKLFKKAECVGVESVKDKPCYKIVMTPNEGPPETRYYDQKSNLLVKVEMSLELAMGTIPIQAFISDYKKVDGVLLAHKTRHVSLGPEILIVTETIEHNVEMPADRFKLPEEVQALADKDKSATEKSEIP